MAKKSKKTESASIQLVEKLVAQAEAEAQQKEVANEAEANEAEANEAQAQAQAQAPAEAELTEEEKNAIICNTTKNQLDECAKRVQKEVNSLNGALKALYKEEIYKNLFDALDCKSYDDARAKVMQAIAYASEDNEGKFIAVTLKPVARFDSTTYYKVQKLNWFTAISQATYRLARGLARVQNVIIDSYYTKSEEENLFCEVTEATICTEIDRQIKVDKYNKLVSRLDKAKLEI